jgi:hypothetical protein
MKPISKSPDRHTFQREGYVKRCEEKGEEPNKDYLDMFEKILNDYDHKFDDPKSKENNLEYDLLTTDWILNKVRSNKAYAQNLYAAMSNNEFVKREMWPILKEEYWSCSWRYAGGIIADMRQEGDYIDWYCSGIRDTSPPSEEEWNNWSEEEQLYWTNIYSKYVGESVITEEIEKDLYELGWLVVKNDKEDL